MKNERPRISETEDVLRSTGYATERMGRREISLTGLFKRSQKREKKPTKVLETAIIALLEESRNPHRLSPFSTQAPVAEGSE